MIWFQIVASDLGQTAGRTLPPEGGESTAVLLARAASLAKRAEKAAASAKSRVGTGSWWVSSWVFELT